MIEIVQFILKRLLESSLVFFTYYATVNKHSKTFQTTQMKSLKFVNHSPQTLWPKSTEICIRNFISHAAISLQIGNRKLEEKPVMLENRYEKKKKRKNTITYRTRIQSVVFYPYLGRRVCLLVTASLRSAVAFRSTASMRQRCVSRARKLPAAESGLQVLENQRLFQRAFFESSSSRVFTLPPHFVRGH